MAAPVVSDHTEALVEKEKHLRVPIIGRQRPAMGKHDWLSLSPVLIVNLRAVFGQDTLAFAITLALIMVSGKVCLELRSP